MRTNDCKSSSSTKCTSSTAISTSEDTDSAETRSIDLSIIENIDYHLRAEEDLANTENYVSGEQGQQKTSDEIPPATTTDQQKTSDEELQSRRRNPIRVLLNKYPEGKRIAALPQEANLSASDIKEIAQITAQYLFSAADPPKRQVLPSVCSFWTENYFAPLFPNTSKERFYFVKNVKYMTKNGKEVNKGRATGALYNQLSLLRKKLLINDQSAKLRTVNREDASRASPSSSTVSAESSTQTPQKIARVSCLRPVHQEETDVPYLPPGMFLVLWMCFSE